MATNQFTEFNIILYAEPTEDLLVSLGCKEYAYICHDNDIIQDTGEFKKKHYHLYVKLYKKKTFGGVFEKLNKWCENCTNVNLIENTLSVSVSIRYLVHKDDLDKFQYEIFEIKSNMDIMNFFELSLTDSQFTLNVIELIDLKEIKSFKELTTYAINNSKLDLLMKRAYFFKSLL